MFKKKIGMSLREKTLTGFFWAVVQQISGQIVSMSVSVVLARLLSPGDFGLMGMIYIFITIGTTLTDAGMSQSLIRILKPENEDYSTVFHVNVLIALVIYAILFFTAPLIAGFYGEEILKGIIRVYGLMFIFSALSSVQNTILVKKMDFKKQLSLSLPSLALSGALGITLAALGYGVWSLVWSGVAKAGLYTIQIWFYSDWRPLAVLDMQRFRYHSGFGIKLTLSGLLNDLASSVYPLAMGKFFTPTQTGYFTQSAAFKQFPFSTILGPISKVAYPALVNLQSDKEKLSATFAKMVRMTLAALTPLMVFGIVLAEPLIVFMLSERWIGAAPYLQIACIAGIISAAGTYNITILKIRNKSGMILRLNLLHKLFMLIAIAAAIPLGIYAVLWSQVVVAIAWFIVFSITACRTIDYSFRRLLSDFLRILSLASVMAAGVWAVRIAVAGTSNLTQLIVCMPVGAIIYAGLILLFEKDILNDLRTLFAGKFTARIDKDRHGKHHKKLIR